MPRLSLFHACRWRQAVCLAAAVVGAVVSSAEEKLLRLAYNQPTLEVDLGVGLWAWPLPMDYDGDGRMDLVVACTGVPNNGLWFFRNSGERDSTGALPLFDPAVYVGSADSPVRPRYDPQISYVNGESVVTTPGVRHPEFKTAGFSRGVKLYDGPDIKPGPGSVRTRQWRLVDYDGDGDTDLVVGVHYGGDHGPGNNYDAQGDWRGGPLRGYTYLLRNNGNDAVPAYAAPEQLQTTEGKPIDVYGFPSPSFADFRGTGKLDLICGEFLDGFTFFENVGTREQPRYAPGRRLMTGDQPLAMALCMITPVAVDFNMDGHVDLISGDEDGRIAFIENTGKVTNGLPQFLPPRYFRQRADKVKYGALASPVSVDWDCDGRSDLIAGNSAGQIGFIRNLGGEPVRWAPPVHLEAGGKVIREQAGPNGSIQGPSEAKWGYSNPSVADWDGDGRLDLITNGVWGRVLFYRNIGSREKPHLAAAEPVEVAWTGATPKPAWNWWNPRGRELVTQWRTTPLVIDWNQDGLQDLVTLDQDGYLTWFERHRNASGGLELRPPRRVFFGENGSVFGSHGELIDSAPGLLRLNSAGEPNPGRSGRRTFCFVDWDGDGTLDLIVNSQPNANLFRGLGQNRHGQWAFRHEGPLHPQVLAGHSTTPAPVDWDGDGVHDLLVGAEDGFFYLIKNPRGASK